MDTEIKKIESTWIAWFEKQKQDTETLRQANKGSVLVSSPLLYFIRHTMTTTTDPHREDICLPSGSMNSRLCNPLMVACLLGANDR